jgi:hypothetical protein
MLSKEGNIKFLQLREYRTLTGNMSPYPLCGKQTGYIFQSPKTITT